jgi:diguanylate cyclase (GGDEF)-like protein/PAS domain S-box-containing protein
LPVAAMVVSHNLEIIAVNIVCQKLLNYSRKELCGSSLAKLLPHKLLKELSLYLGKVNQKNSNHLKSNKSMELNLRDSQGEFIPVRCSVKKLNLSQESPFIIVIEDISEEIDSRANYLYQQKWDLLFADYSQYFITLPANQVKYLIKRLLTSAAKLLACQRVSLYLFSPGSNHANLEFEWHESQAASLKEYSHRVYFSRQMPEIMTLLSGKTQVLYPQKKSQQAKLTQCLGISEHLAHVGSVSSYIAPLVYQKGVFGWLGFDFEYAPRQWESTDQEHLQTLTKIVNKAYRRKKYEELRQLTHAKLVESNTKLNRQASIDELTQLANRRYFDYVLQEEVRRASRDDSYLCVIFCDIDYFKNYNDYYGHVAGDRCLKRIARVLQESFQRAGDFVARYGGEEFAIILPRIDGQRAYEAADKMRHRLFMLNLPHQNSPLSRVSISAGLTCVQTKNLTTIESLIDGADKALYRAKQHGRNRVFAYRKQQFE